MPETRQAATPEVAKLARDLWQALPRVPEIEDVAALLQEHVIPIIEQQTRAKVTEDLRRYAEWFNPKDRPKGESVIWEAFRVAARIAETGQP